MPIRELERDIERKAVKAITRRWKCKVRKMNGFGHRSWPDRAFFFDGGLVVFIEFKRPGETSSPSQQQLQLELRLLDFEVFECDSVTQAVNACEAAIKRHRGRCT